MKNRPDGRFIQSGRKDLNLRPLAPHASALAGLRHAPMTDRRYYSAFQGFMQYLCVFCLLENGITAPNINITID
jgi:hypothetical protein